MSEKSAEEKLRQALEGNITGDNGTKDSRNSNPKPRPRVKSHSPRTAKPDNISQRVDSFMDDFERMVGQSLSTVKSPAESQEKQRQPIKPARKPASPKTKPEIHNEPEKIPDPLPEIPDIIPEPATPVQEHEIIPETAAPEIAIEPEIEPAEPVSEPEPEIIPEVMPVSDIDSELPDIPVIEADFSPARENSHTDSDTDGGLPDIPVINAEDDFDSPQDDTESLIEAVNEEFSPPEIDDTPQDDNPTESPQDPQNDFQEAELLEAPDVDDDDFADISDDFAEAMPETEADFTDDFSDEPIDEEPAIFDAEDDDDEADDFSPGADVVVSVDDELPQISAQPEPLPDPEAESAPVSVTMPESTKTAEDKLMADIAEAMTGNPLTLDAQEKHGDFALPENFFTDNATSGDSPQSAEDKLKANIAQALSESPIDTAQNQASQDLEQDINPFDELPEFEPEITPQEIPDDEAPLEPEYEPDEPVNLDDTGDDPFADVDFSDSEPEHEPEPEPESFPEIDTEDSGDMPFTIDETEPEFFPEPETDPEPEPEPEPEIFTETEPQADDDMPFTLEDSHPEDVPAPEPEHLTEQDRLEQEIAALTQETEPEIFTAQEEAQQDNDMPEQSLLDDGTQEGFSTDDDNDNWNVDALGVLSEAATIPDEDESDDFSAVPETVTEMITPNLDDEHKEKTMSIREKLALRKDGASDNAPAPKKKSSSSSSGGGGILLPLLLGIIAIIGGVMLWQIMTLSDKITSLAMSSPSFESVPGIEANPSYDYAIDFILDPNLSDRMAQRGRDGWQVVGSRRTQDSTTGQYGYELIFMRRTPGR